MIFPTETTNVTPSLDDVILLARADSDGELGDCTLEEVKQLFGVDSKVDEEEGKGLSTNDYTNADKGTLYGLVGRILSLSALIAGARMSIGKKQDKLISGDNIKTVGGTSLLGPGNIDLGSVDTSIPAIRSLL